MSEIRYWSPEPNCKLNFFAGDKLEYPPVTNWLRGGDLPYATPPYAYQAFRVSLFWSLYVTPDALFEVEIDDATKNAGFWSPNDPRWRISHIYGYRLVTKLKPIRVIGTINPDNVLAFLEALKPINMLELAATPFWQEQNLAKPENYTQAIAMLKPLEKEGHHLTYRNIPRQIIYQLEQTIAHTRSAKYYLKLANKRHVRQNQPAAVRQVVGSFALAITWANKACNEPGNASAHIPVEWFKNYRTVVNNLMFDNVVKKIE